MNIFELAAFATNCVAGFLAGSFLAHRMDPIGPAGWIGGWVIGVPAGFACSAVYIHGLGKLLGRLGESCAHGRLRRSAPSGMEINAAVVANCLAAYCAGKFLAGKIGAAGWIVGGPLGFISTASLIECLLSVRESRRERRRRGSERSEGDAGRSAAPP